MGITNLDRLELGGVEITPPITEAVNKTVGLGKDFISLHDALKWATQQSIGGDDAARAPTMGLIQLILDDGTHVIDVSALDETNVTNLYVFTNTSLLIRSASNNKNNCIISLENISTIQSKFIFRAFNSSIDISYVTVNDNNAGNVLTFGFFENCYYNSQNLVINDFLHGVVLSKGSSGRFYGCTLTGRVDSNNSAVSVHYNASAILMATVIDYFAFGLSADIGSNIHGGQYGTFSFGGNNTADTNIPLNEIQYDGSFISDHTAALSFKA